MELPPFLSIGVNAYNEEASIARMLESVFKSSLWKAMPPNKRELIVCANGCTDGTARTVKDLMRDNPGLKLLETKERGFAFARNLLAKRMSSKADVFFFFDADVLVRRKTLETLFRALRENPRIDVAAAEVMPAAKFVHPNARKGFAKYSVDRFESIRAQRANRISGAGYAVRRDVIRGIHLPEQLQGSVDLYLTLKIGRSRVARVREAQVVFKDIASFNDYRKRWIRYFFSHSQLREMFPHQKPVYVRSLREKMQLFGKLPADAKLASLGVEGSKIVAKAQAKLALRRKKKGKRTDAWKQTKSDKIGRRRT